MAEQKKIYDTGSMPKWEVRALYPPHTRLRRNIDVLLLLCLVHSFVLII